MPLFSVAQRSDIYITGNNAASSVYSVNSEWEQTSVEEHSSIQTPIQSGVVSKSSTSVENPMERNIDEYNRRYSNNTSTSSISEITYSDNNAVWVDTVYIEKSNDIAYAEGYSDASQDYEYALRMIRFRSPRLSFHISSPFYWDVVYGSSFYSLYDYYWDMDWYLDPFGYNWYPNSYYIGSPFLYSRIWYNTWYGPWYNSWYNPIYVGIPVYFTRGESAFVPNRSVNTGWSRNLAGSSRGIRDSFSGVSRNDRDLSSSRPSSTRSIQTDSRAASSRTITDMRPTDRTDRTTNSSGANTVSSVRVVSPGASSRSNVATNSTSRIIETEVSTVRSVQSGTTYTRPSSTSSRVVTTPSESRSIINRDNSSGSAVQTRTNTGTSSSSSRIVTPSASSSSSSRVATPSASSSSSSRVVTPSASSSSSSRGSASSSRR